MILYWAWKTENGWRAKNSRKKFVVATEIKEMEEASEQEVVKGLVRSVENPLNRNKTR